MTQGAAARQASTETAKGDDTVQDNDCGPIVTVSVGISGVVVVVGWAGGVGGGCPRSRGACVLGGGGGGDSCIARNKDEPQ